MFGAGGDPPAGLFGEPELFGADEDMEDEQMEADMAEHEEAMAQLDALLEAKEQIELATEAAIAAFGERTSRESRRG